MNVFDKPIIDASHAMYDAAMEISKDDPTILTCDFESFCNSMWTDDADRKARKLSREDYRLALQSAWEQLPR